MVGFHPGGELHGEIPRFLGCDHYWRACRGSDTLGRGSVVGGAISPGGYRGSSRSGITAEEISKGAKARVDGGIVRVVKRFRW